MNQGDLCQFLSQKSDLSRDARLGIAYEVVYIIYQLHEEMHIYHRDIKLENFLVDTPEEGVIKISITDFGFATKKPFANDFKGTLDYCAPESLPFLHNRDRLHFYDLKQADLYSLGATVYSLLAGKNLDEQLKKIMSKDKSRDTLESTRLELIQKNLEHYPKEVIDSVISLTNPLAGARPTTIDVLAVFEKLFPQDGI
jgi:serine/threonine protein kinase